MNRLLSGLAIAAVVAGFTDFGTREARAQFPGETVVYQTAVPGPPVISYGEAYKVRYRPRKVVMKERPFAYVAPSAPIVRQTRVIRPAPVVESRVIQPAPIVEQRIVQPAPVIESRVIPSSPVIQTRYYAPYPY